MKQAFTILLVAAGPALAATAAPAPADAASMTLIGLGLLFTASLARRHTRNRG